MLSFHTVHIRNAQLSKNSHLQGSAFKKIKFAKLSFHKVHIHYLQGSALVKLIFARLSTRKVHIRYAQFS